MMRLETWTAVLSPIPAGKRPVTANEVLRNPQITGEVEVVWTIRHPGVVLNSKMRVEDEDGRLYEIRGINELPGRREGFEIRAVSLDKTGATIA